MKVVVPILMLLPAMPAALGQDTSQDETVGPGRIVCNASFCVLGIGTQPKVRFRIDVSTLPDADIKRLRKCTGVAACIVTIEGKEVAGPARIMADSIHWDE